GRGRRSLRIMQAEAEHVTGFDISEKRVDEARSCLARHRYADRSQFIVADAHGTRFADGEFELIVGGHILHHLDFDVALREVERLLAPSGRAVFTEPLAQNPLLRFARWASPFARSDDEEPLTE